MFEKRRKRYINMTDEEKEKKRAKAREYCHQDDPCFNPRYDTQFCLFMLFDNSNFWSM